MGIILVMEGFVNIWKLINEINIPTKKEIHMTTSIDAEKVFDKIQQQCMIKKKKPTNPKLSVNQEYRGTFSIW